MTVDEWATDMAAMIDPAELARELRACAAARRAVGDTGSEHDRELMRIAMIALVDRVTELARRAGWEVDG